MTARERQARGDPLRRGDEVRHHALVLAGVPVPGAAEPGLDLVGHEDDARSPAPVGERRKESVRRDDEAALAEDRLDDERGHVRGPHLDLDLVDRAARRLGARHPRGVAEGVRHRHTVDLGRERPEALFVRHHLGGHRHREVRPPVVGVVEDDDGRPAGRDAGDLHRVLDCLGSGVEKRRRLVVIAGGERVQLLADCDVRLVGRDHEAGVGERGNLLRHRRDDLGRGVANAGDGDPGAEVDEAVAVQVLDDRPGGARDVGRERGRDPGRDGAPAPGVEGARARTRQLGPDLATLGHTFSRRMLAVFHSPSLLLFAYSPM